MKTKYYKAITKIAKLTWVVFSQKSELNRESCCFSNILIKFFNTQIIMSGNDGNVYVSGYKCIIYNDNNITCVLTESIFVMNKREGLLLQSVRW